MEELNGKEFSTLKEFHDFFDNAKKIDRQSFVVRSSYPITKVQKELVQKLNGEEVSLIFQNTPKYYSAVRSVRNDQQQAKESGKSSKYLLYY